MKILSHLLIARKQSNSSESSESTQSGKTSPILSPGMRQLQQASPTKTISGKTLTKIELFRQSVGAFETHAIVSRNVGEDVIACSETVYCLTDR